MRTTVYNLTLKYSDGRADFFVGSFDSEAKANAWLTEERTRSYWSESVTTIQIVAVTSGIED